MIVHKLPPFLVGLVPMITTAIQTSDLVCLMLKVNHKYFEEHFSLNLNIDSSNLIVNITVEQGCTY